MSDPILKKFEKADWERVDEEDAETYWKRKRAECLMREKDPELYALYKKNQKEAAQLERLKNGAHEQERLEARAMLAARQAKLEHAQHELERATRLLKTGATEQELDRWKADVARSLSSERPMVAVSAQVSTHPCRIRRHRGR